MKTPLIKNEDPMMENKDSLIKNEDPACDWKPGFRQGLC